MTQLVVEVVTTVLFLLGLRWLPKRIERDDPSIVLQARIRGTRDLMLAIFAGAGLAALSYAMLTCSSTTLSWNSRSAMGHAAAQALVLRRRRNDVALDKTFGFVTEAPRSRDVPVRDAILCSAPASLRSRLEANPAEGTAMGVDTSEPAFDPPRGDSPLSGEEIRKAASESVRAGVDIRARIHDVTLLALRSRRFDRHGMRDVVQAVTGGVAMGAEESRADLRKALAEALRGMDEALTRSADASRVALRQLVVTGRDLSDNDLKQALANMKRLEDDFLATAGQAAEATSEKVRPELERLLDTARQNGTETGRMAAATLTELTQRFSIASLDVALASVEVATEVGSRFALLAGGILSGIADALTDPRSDKQPR